jgi:2-deoxy-D-gluconate 3-dehydrogenase
MDKYGLDSIFNLAGKTAIITGATKGIGKEFALLLGNKGVNVALIARSEKELDNVKREIEASGGKAHTYPLDLTDTEKIPEVVRDINESFGNIDILVNNAGMNRAKPAEKVTDDDWDAVMDLNLKSTFFITQAVGKYMRKQKNGKIINISSQMAFVGYFDRAAYATSKGGLTQMTKALSIEWAKDNINVNAIAPTFIETEMTKSMFEDTAFKEEVLGRIPLGRLAKEEDLFGALIYLSSGASDMVTGHTILVDGGWTVW